MIPPSKGPTDSVIVAVLGPDQFLAQQELQKLTAKHDPDGFNTSMLDASSASPEELISAVATPPFLGDYRVVVVSGFFRELKSRQNIDLSNLCAQTQDSVILVLMEPDAATLPKGVKSALGPRATVIQSAAPRGKALIDWIDRHATAAGSSIDQSASKTLADRMFPGSWQQASRNPAFDKPPDLLRLGSELQKLATAAAPGAITEKLVNDLVAADHEERAFGLQDAVMQGDRRLAVREIANLGLTKDDAARTLAMLFQQIEFACAASSAGRPQDLAEAGRALGMTNPNRIKMVLRSSTREAGYYAQLLQIALTTDRRIKRGNEPDPLSALHYLVESLPR